MNDKLQQLYNLYLENGILTDATSFETFSQANGNQIDALYNLGQENGLFVTTDLDTFSGAWAQQPEVTPIEPPVKKKEDTIQEVEEDTESVSEDGSLVSPGAEEVTEETFTKEYVEPLPFEPLSDDKPNILEEIGVNIKPFEKKSFTFKMDERARRSKMTPEQRRRREIELKPELELMYPKGVPEEVVQMYINAEDAEIKNKLNLLDAYNEAITNAGGEPMSTAEYVGGVQGVENIMVDEYGYRKIEDFRYPSKKSIIEEVTTTDILSPDYPLQKKEDIETVRKRVSPVSVEKKKQFVNNIIAIDNTMLGDYDVDPVSGDLVNNSQLDFIDVLDDKSYDEREEEIEKNKFRNAFIKNNIPQELYQDNKYKSLSYEDLIMLNARAIDNFKRSYGEQEWEEYQKISGNSNPSLIGTKYENQDISNSKIQDLVVIGDEDATVANLSKEFPLFDFEVTKASTFGIDHDQYGDYITISTKDNQGRVVNSIDIYLEEENNPVERIRGFMQGALLSRKDKAFLDKADGYYKDIDGIVGRSTQSISQYEKENFGKDPIKELQIYNEIISNPKKFGDGNSPAMYGKDRSIGAVNVEQIESFLDKNKGNIAPEVIEMLRYKMAVSEGVYSEQLAQQGSWASAINTGLAKFIYGFSEGGTGLLMSLPKTGATNEETRQIKNDILDAIESAKERFAATTAESMAVRPMSQKAADAIVDMIPSILFGGRVAKGLGLAGEVVGVGRKAKQLLATGSGFAPQTYGAISQELKDADIPEYQKGLLALPITLVEQMLEGISGITILNKGNFPIFMNVAIKTLKDLPKNASEKTIRAALRTNLKSRLTSLGGELATMSITEGATEGTQTISEDLFKRIYNTFYDKDVFKVPDLSTKEGVQRYVDALVESIELGMISGPVGGGGFRAVGSLQNGFKTRQENKAFKFLYNDLMNDADLTKRKVDLKLALEEGQITQEKYDDAIDVLDNGKGLMSQIPEDLSTNSKRQAFVLLREKQQIEEEIAGKNKELEFDNVQRLKEIDFLLKNVGQKKQKTDAISEQETTPVDEDQQATDVQEVEKGVSTAEPQQTTVEKTTTEEVEKAPLTEEQQEVVSLEEEIEGKVTEGRELPGQEVVEETQEVTEEAPVDDRKLIYDEKKSRSKGQQLVIDRAQRAIKALSKIAPDVKIIVHEDTKSFKKAAGGEGAGAITGGNTIHVNMDKANPRTIAHEVMHAVLIKKLGTESDIRKVTARMLEAVKKGLIKGGGKVEITIPETIDGKRVETKREVTIEKYLEMFSEQYEENMQDEEKVAELAGLLANNYTNLEVKEKSVIKRWIQKVFKPIADKLGINLNEVTKTDKDIIDFLNVVSRKTTLGEQIQEAETEALTRVKEEVPAKKKVTKKKPKETTKKEAPPVVEKAPTKKKINWTKSEGKRPKRKTQGTELGKLVRQYESGEITIEEYNEQAEKLSPTRMKEKFTEPATEAELGKLRKGKLEKRNAKVEDGVEVGLRIDIPFMEDTGQASVTIHKGKGLSSPAVSYRGSAVIENVEFKSSPSGSLKLASEVTTKNPTLARMVGNFVNIGETIEQQNEAAKKLSEQAMNEGWTQVGVNPSKHSYFYDRATGKPLKSADRVVQVGDLIYAENAQTTDIYDDRFIVKGKTDKAGKPLRFQKADIKLIAPNGKPSNLNQQQYDLVRTPAFKNWFGDWQNDPKNASKIVDENGEPMVVYHGTFNNFEAFDRSKGGTNTASVFSMPRNNWFWFSNNKDISSSYGSKILPVFLNVRNPQKAEGKKLNTAYKDALRLKKDGIIAEEVNDSRRTSQSLEVQTEDDVELISIDAKDFTGSLRSEIYGGTSIEEMIDLLESYIEYSKGEVAQYKEQYPRDAEYLETQMDQARRMINAFKKYGRDGVKVGEPIKGDVFAIEKSNQAKLADGSNKTFDPQDERIRFQKADIEVDKISTRFQSDFSDRLTKLSFVYDKNGERFNKLKKDGFITTDKKIQDYDGQIMFLHQPDGAFSGMIYKDGEILVEGSGGMYYPIKFHQDGFFWASTEDAAKSMARKLNESMDQNGGKLLMGLITAPSDKLLSSTTMSNAVMDFFSSKAFDKTFNLTENQLRVALRKAANQKLVQVDKKTGKKKTIGLNLNIPASATVEQIKSEIQEKLGHDNSSFKDRKFFATELIGNMADVINRSQASVNQFGKLFSEGIQNEYFKGVTKTGKLKISKANMVQALSEMFTEPVLKSESLRDKSGQVYAVLELDSKVKPVKSDKHKSYPFALKSVNKNAKVKLNVLEEGQLWGEVFEDPETNDIITKERLTNVLPTNAGVSTQGLRVNTSRIASQEVSEIEDREQKSLIQIGRYYNANNQGFFPAQVNEFQLRRDLQAIGLDLKRAKNGAYYPTRNGRKVNIFPTPPSPYARFQRADIEITEPTVFNKKDTAEDIIRTARKKGYNDKSIRFYLLNRRKGEFKAKEVDALLKIDATLFDQLPESFAEVEGGAIAGLKLFEKIDKFRQKLMNQNNRIKKPFLEEKQIQELVKEKRKELKKQGLSKEEIRKKLEAFEKRERANNKKRTKRLTLSEIMDKTIEFMEQQPEYKREADSYEVDVKARKKAGFDKGITKYRKGISTQQAKMQAELQETIGQKPTKEVAENLAKLKRNVKSWEKGQRDLQAIKNELKRLMRKHLPKEMYSRKEALDLIKAISDANKDNINVQIEKVQEVIVKKTNQRLTNEALELLNIETQKKQSGRLKGVKVSNEVRKRLERIKKNVLDPKDLNFKDEIAVTERNAELTRQFNELNKKVEKTQEDFQEMNDLQIAIGLNQAQLLEMNDSYRISPMETVVDSLDRLIMGGRGMFQLELEQAHAEYQRQFAELWEQITGQKLDMSDPDVQDKINETLSKDYSRKDKDAAVNRFARIFVRAYRSIGSGINRHEALFGLMDKINVMPGELAGGRIQEIITERVDEASIKYKGRMMEQETIIEDKGKEIFGRRWKSKLRNFNEISLIDPEFVFKLPNRKRSLSQNEMAYMYNQFKDPTLHPTFESMLGENYEQIMKELESKLDPKLKQWADWMVDEYFPSVYEHYNETYKKIYRTDMPFNENYAGRIFREGIEENKPLDLLGEASIYQTSVAPASTKERVNNKNHIIPMDINTALTTYVQDMEYFAAYAEPMRDIHKMFSNNNTKDFLINQYGEKINIMIQNQITKISGKGTKNYATALFVNTFTNMFIFSRLALSPVVFLKQLTSSFTYANDIGIGNWLKYSASSILKTPAGMGKTWREISENSVYLQDRAKGANIKRAISNYYDIGGNLFRNDFVEGMQRALMITTRKGDKLAIMLGGMPNYLYYKDQYRKQNPTATEQEVIDYAIKKFERDTKQTQQSSDIQDRDYYQTGDGFSRAFNMFLTTPKQYLRKEIVALRNLRKIMTGKGDQARGTLTENARQFVMYHFIMPMLYQWVASGFPMIDDWEEEDTSDMARAAIIGNFNGLFLIGDVIQSLGDMFTDKPWAGNMGGLPFLDQAGVLMKTYMKYNKEATKDKPNEEKLDELKYEFIMDIGETVGLPVSKIDKVINNAAKYEDAKTVKEKLLRILLYSDYVIEGSKDKKKKKKKGGVFKSKKKD